MKIWKNECKLINLLLIIILLFKYALNLLFKSIYYIFKCIKLYFNTYYTYFVYILL